jgi:4-diphosphocytidyl-2-C-methyl-D-erythritol kinase
VELIRSRYRVAPGARIHLTKRIPAQAGLGGGSSDAAAGLLLANRAFHLGLSTAELASLAAELGSDVPFFLYGGPAICRGRGEMVEPLARLGNLHFVVAKPREGLATPGVFAALGEIGRVDGAEPAALDKRRPVRSPRLAALIAALDTGRLSAAGRLLFNGLEEAALRLAPALRGVAERMAALGLCGFRLTGSGSGFFGLCQTARQALRAAAWLRGQELEAMATGGRW